MFSRADRAVLRHALAADVLAALDALAPLLLPVLRLQLREVDRLLILISGREHWLVQRLVAQALQHFHRELISFILIVLASRRPAF